MSGEKRELIDRGEAIGKVMGVLLQYGLVYGTKEPKDDKDREIIRALKNMPAAEPEQKTGYWRPVRIGNYHGFECTNCRVIMNVPCGNNGIPQHAYCPECGARMETEHE